ncbi:hypothetical protein LARV_03751 [Longilinea arvoryzae]|uniref:Uncharacterized protein n=1 Tax=Longilinea arvoryzae TaxID=360412 RepID=A0A0K8MY63_9CHLR|nr:hypothetical protein [Longilinea arvoryzae]GAP15956.1 hypothetical protein LARV_03751 [Longilinea arvoryzae]
MILTRSMTHTGLLAARWLLAGALTFGLGLPLSWLLVFGIQKLAPINEDRFWPITIFLCVGLLLGLFQALLAGPAIPRLGRWFAATAIGSLFLLLPVVISYFFESLIPNSTALTVFLFIYSGVSLGLAQWVVLRTRYRAAGWWILVYVAGLACLFPLGSIGFHNLWDLALQSMLTGLLFSLPAALLLFWLVRSGQQITGTPGSGGSKP